ncbi:hypothetical protein HDU67_000248, partial [Dinochytrium kinnereticum]
MTFFNGPVASAIALALGGGGGGAKPKLLIVLISDGSLDSTEFTTVFQDSAVADFISRHAVAIHLTRGSEDESNFSKIYPVFMVPSIYVIKGGVGVDVVFKAPGGDTPSAEEVVGRFKRHAGEETVDSTAASRAAWSNATAIPASTPQPQPARTATPPPVAPVTRAPIKINIRRAQPHPTVPATPPQQAAASTKPARDDTAFLAIRFPDGRILREKFEAERTLEDVRVFIERSEPSFKAFEICQTYPMKTFTPAEERSTLK